MPLDFYNNHPELKGVTEGDHAALCTSAPEIQRYIQASVESICRAVPDLGGIFTITASENLTNCWSHGRGAACPRCGKRTPADVIAEVNTLLFTGIQKSGAATRLIAWDWGWADSWTEDVIRRLPTNAWLMSVSEWSVPIERGGIKSEVGEYSLSTIGPGPRASRNWAAAKQHGMRTIAKVQASNSWESSAVPYVPAVDYAYMHSAALDKAGIDGIMLGWTLGGYPSPNLEVVGARSTLLSTGKRRFGAAAPAVVKAWKEFSEAFRQFPFNVGTVYSAPLQVGPANLLWGKSTGYAASMVGIPYDDLESWRSIYPPEIFANQLQKVAAGFEKAVDALKFGISSLAGAMTSNQRRELAREIDVADAAAIHFRSVANQARFIYARESLSKTPELTKRRERIAELSGILTEEISLAKRLHAIQTRDSRIGFEATNQYYYVPTDLAEKVINCQYLLNRWLPELAGRNGAEQSGNSHQK
jgi:hypothetical protein